MARASLYTSSYIHGTTFNSDGTRVIKNPRIYFNRSVDSGTGDVTSEYGALRWGSYNRVYWDSEKVEVSAPIVLTDDALPTEDAHAVNKSYADRLLQIAGLNLGTFKYRRSGDVHGAGSIKSNTTTNPQNITQIDIYKSNLSGVLFGQDLYLATIQTGMWFCFRDKASAHYVGKITEISAISNGVRLTLNALSGEITGTVYYDNQYEVSIGYNRYGSKYPQ